MGIEEVSCGEQEVIRQVGGEGGESAGHIGGWGEGGWGGGEVVSAVSEAPREDFAGAGVVGVGGVVARVDSGVAGRGGVAWAGVVYRDRLYPPWITLWIFLWQVLSPDCKCQCALVSWFAARGFQGLGSCSIESGSYRDARKRLPLELVRQLVSRTGQEVRPGAGSAGLFHGRVTKVVDGAIASMPDTPENAEYFHKPGNQTSTPLFPALRMVVVFCLATGAALDHALGPYRGKETGELGLFRTLRRAFEKFDIIIGDRIFGTDCDIAQLLAQGVDGVYRMHAKRHADFRKGQRLGKDDHLVEWSRPVKRPDWLTLEEWALIPLTLTLREIRVRIAIPGCRVKSLVILTTLRDPIEYPAREIAQLYRDRWHSELDLVSASEKQAVRDLCPLSPLATRPLGRTWLWGEGAETGSCLLF